MYVERPSQKRKNASEAIIRRWKSLDGPGDGICSICDRVSGDEHKKSGVELVSVARINTDIVYPVPCYPVEAPEKVQHREQGDERRVKVVPRDTSCQRVMYLRERFKSG